MEYEEITPPSSESIALCEELGRRLKQHGINVPGSAELLGVSDTGLLSAVDPVDLPDTLLTGSEEDDAEGGRGFWFNAPDNGYPEVQKRTAWLVVRNTGKIMLILYGRSDHCSVFDVVLDPSQARKFGPISVPHAVAELKSHFSCPFSYETEYSFYDWLRHSPPCVRNAWKKVISGAGETNIPLPIIAVSDRWHNWSNAGSFVWEIPILFENNRAILQIEACISDHGTVDWFSGVMDRGYSRVRCQKEDDLSHFSSEFYDLFRESII